MGRLVEPTRESRQEMPADLGILSAEVVREAPSLNGGTQEEEPVTGRLGGRRTARGQWARTQRGGAPEGGREWRGASQSVCVCE